MSRPWIQISALAGTSIAWILSFPDAITLGLATWFCLGISWAFFRQRPRWVPWSAFAAGGVLPLFVTVSLQQWSDYKIFLLVALLLWAMNSSYDAWQGHPSSGKNWRRYMIPVAILSGLALIYFALPFIGGPGVSRSLDLRSGFGLFASALFFLSGLALLLLIRESWVKNRGSPRPPKDAGDGNP